MRLGDPDRVAAAREVALWLLIVVAIIGGINGSIALFERAFPEPLPAGEQTRLVLCGRMGRYRLFCGVSDDFVGPTESLARQWNRKPSEVR